MTRTVITADPGDVSVAELATAVARDPGLRLLLLYLESIADAARGLPEDTDGVIATATDGHRENLAVLIRTEPLTAVFSQHPARDRSVRSFWKHLRLIEVRAPEGSTQDVDTWEDVSRFDLH